MSRPPLAVLILGSSSDGCRSRVMRGQHEVAFCPAGLRSGRALWLIGAPVLRLSSFARSQDLLMLLGSLTNNLSVPGLNSFDHDSFFGVNFR